MAVFVYKMYVYTMKGKIRLTESGLRRIVRVSVNKVLVKNEQFTNNQNYSHFTVNKEANRFFAKKKCPGPNPILMSVKEK